MYTQLLNTSTDRDSTTSLGNLCQVLPYVQTEPLMFEFCSLPVTDIHINELDNALKTDAKRKSF